MLTASLEIASEDLTSTELKGELTRSTVYDGPNVHRGLGRDGEKNIMKG